MSFSQNVKRELAKKKEQPRHCMIAFLTSVIGACGIKCEGGALKIVSENRLVIKKARRLIDGLFGISPQVGIKKTAAGRFSAGSIVIPDPFDAKRVLEATKFYGKDGHIRALGGAADGRILNAACCRRAYLEGAFLCSGSISDPQSSYHFEIVNRTKERAGQLAGILEGFGIESGIVGRKGHFVLYVKDAEAIAEVLRLMDAGKSLMEMENLRILHSIKGTVNRRVNCETANLKKTTGAAVSQIMDIRLIERTVGLDSLPDGLREAAMVRMEHPQAPLSELCRYMSPPVGKSGMNHRLRRIRAIADEYR